MQFIVDSNRQDIKSSVTQSDRCNTDSRLPITLSSHRFSHSIRPYVRESREVGPRLHFARPPAAVPSPEGLPRAVTISAPTASDKLIAPRAGDPRAYVTNLMARCKRDRRTIAGDDRARRYRGKLVCQRLERNALARTFARAADLKPLSHRDRFSNGP